MADNMEKNNMKNEEANNHEPETVETEVGKSAEDNITISKAEYEQLIHDQAKSAEYFDQMLRIQAEFENYRKRMSKEKTDFLKYANEKLISEILPILDNFNRALVALEDHVTKQNHKFFEGVEMIYRQINNLMENHGVKPIESEGKAFDPSIHHAVQIVETNDVPEGTVVQELAKGYTLNDRLIRAATVIVSKPKSDNQQENN